MEAVFLVFGGDKDEGRCVLEGSEKVEKIAHTFLGKADAEGSGINPELERRRGRGGGVESFREGREVVKGEVGEFGEVEFYFLGLGGDLRIR